MLLPGGYGAHVELGLAIAREIPILICMSKEEDMIAPNGYNCPFYWNENCTRVVGSLKQIVEHIKRI